MAGGYGDKRLSSTEILVTLAGEWRTVGQLPSALRGLRGATLDNTVYMTGEWCIDIYSVMVCWHSNASHVSGGEDGDSVYDTILSYNPDTEQWSPAGSMRERRAYHAVETVNLAEVEQCSNTASDQNFNSVPSFLFLSSLVSFKILFFSF